jgi:hypothetical protein
MRKAGEPVSLVRLARKIIARSTRWRIAVFLAACLFPALVVAQNDNWLGGTGFWSDGTKWSAGEPGSGNSVFIDHGKAGSSAVTINFNGAQCASLTIDSDDSLTLVDGTLFTVFGPNISNAGTLSISTSTTNSILDVSGAVTLTGVGGLTMSNNSGNTMMGYGQPDNSSLTNQTTIQGAGTIGQIPGNSSLVNQRTINANQTTPLNIYFGGGALTNTGTLEATNNATLVLRGSSTIANTSGTIHADPGHSFNEVEAIHRFGNHDGILPRRMSLTGHSLKIPWSGCGPSLPGWKRSFTGRPVPLGRSVLTTDGLAQWHRWRESPRCLQVGQWGFSDIAWNLSRPASVRVSRGLQRIETHRSPTRREGVLSDK